MNKKFIFRIAEKADIDQLVKMRINYLIEDIGEEVVKKEIINLEQEIYRYLEENLSKEVDAFVAEIDGEIVSSSFTVYYQRLPHVFFPKGKVGIPINGYTKPNYRKLGMASKLLELSAEHACQKGVEILHMEVTKKGYYTCSKIGLKKQNIYQFKRNYNIYI